MKKSLIVLASLALVTAGAFAQTAPSNLKIGGYLDVGSQTVIKSDSGSTTFFKGDDSGVSGGSFELNGAYALTDMAGFNWKLRFEDLAAGASAKTNIENAYVYFKVPGAEMLKVLAGNIDGSGWGANDDNGANVSGGMGVQAQFTPVAGLTAGVQAGPKVDGNNTVFSFGATYALDKVGTFVAGAATGDDKDKNTALSTAYVSGSISAVDKLTLKGGYNLGGLGTDSKGTNFADLTVGYALSDALSATLTGYAWTYGTNIKTAAGDAADLSYKVNPSVSYTVSPVIAIGLGGTYQSGVSVLGTTAPLNKVAKTEVNPNATVTIDANTKLYINYVYDALSGDDTKGSTDLTAQTIKFDFRYSF